MAQTNAKIDKAFIFLFKVTDTFNDSAVLQNILSST